MTFIPNGPAAIPNGPAAHGGGFRVQPADALSWLRESRPNMLVSGPRDATDAFILAVTPSLHVPVRDCSSCEALLTPPANGTLILRDVDALDRDQQQCLLRWLDDPQNGQTQVMSLTASPLYAAVRAGTFVDRLYYRLNVIHFEVTPD